MCGGNGRLLWPRPTGPVDLGPDNLIFQWQQLELVTVNTDNQDVKEMLEHAKEVFLGNNLSIFYCCIVVIK